MSFVRKNSGQWVMGILLLVIGVVFLLENIIGIEIWQKIWSFWPVILIFWSMSELFQKKSIFFGLILLAIGIVILLKNLDLYQLSDTIWKFWPVIIIALGFDHLFSKSDSPMVHQDLSRKKNKKIITQDDEII